MTGARPSLAARWAVRGIALYQAARAGRPTACRFVPTCSAYAAEAIAARGLVAGGALSLRRLVRCRPFGPHGIDPVPSARAAR